MSKTTFKNNNPVLLLDLHYASLQVARRLARMGVKVYGVDKTKDPLGSHSRYIERLQAPPEWDNLKDFLISFARKSKKTPILYPLSDYYLRFFLKYAEELGRYYHFPYANLDVVGKLLSKIETAKLLDALSIHHPRSYFIQHDQDSLSISTQIQFPCILKPEYQYCWEGSLAVCEFLGCGQRVLMVKNYDDLKKAIRVLSPFGDMILQEFVSGPSWNSYYYVGYRDKGGKILLSYLGNKIRTLPDKLGSETLLISVHNRELLEVGNNILHKLDYVGPVGIDFKYDHQKESFFVIEINPRIGINDCYLASWGLDPAWFYYLDSQGISLNPSMTYPEGISWYDLIRDFDWMREYRKQYRVTWYGWLKSLFHESHDSDALFDWCDMAVFGYMLRERIMTKIKRFVQN